MHTVKGTKQNYITKHPEGDIYIGKNNPCIQINSLVTTVLRSKFLLEYRHNKSFRNPRSNPVLLLWLCFVPGFRCPSNNCHGRVVRMVRLL